MHLLPRFWQAFFVRSTSNRRPTVVEPHQLKLSTFDHFLVRGLVRNQYSADTTVPCCRCTLALRRKKIRLVPMRRNSSLSILPRRCEVVGCVSLRFLLPFDHPTFRSATCDTRFKSRQVIHECPCLRYIAASPIKTTFLTGANVNNAVSFLPFLPFLIFISKCGMMRLPWSQYWSLASFSAKSINVRILVCRAHILISSTFLFAIRQLLVMGFELTSVLGMGRGFPGPVIPPIFHISTCYLRAFISLLGILCRGCPFSLRFHTISLILSSMIARGNA